MTPTLFQRLLGAEFYHLAPEVKALHARQGHFRYQGRCSVERGGTMLARMAGWLARLPPAMDDAELQVEFTAEGARETWQRRFGTVPMHSQLQYRDGRLHERLGAIRFQFRLYRIGSELHWVTEGARLFGVLPWPARWLDEVRCRERGEDGCYRFEIDARLPVLGRLVRYHGWLRPDENLPDDGQPDPT